MWRRGAGSLPGCRRLPGGARADGPPLRLRQTPASLPTCALSACLARLPAAEAAWEAHEARRKRAAALAELREIDYSVAYDLARALPGAPEVGPLHVLHSAHFDLLVSWIATRNSLVRWHALVAITRLRAPGRRLLALRRWRQGSAALGELGWAQPVLQLPREIPSELALIVVRRLLTSAARGCQHRYSWLRARVHVVRSREVTFARLRINGSWDPAG